MLKRKGVWFEPAGTILVAFMHTSSLVCPHGMMEFHTPAPIHVQVPKCKTWLSHLAVTIHKSFRLDTKPAQRKELQTVAQQATPALLFLATIATGCTVHTYTAAACTALAHPGSCMPWTMAPPWCHQVEPCLSAWAPQTPRERSATPLTAAPCDGSVACPHQPLSTRCASSPGGGAGALLKSPQLRQS